MGSRLGIRVICSCNINTVTSVSVNHRYVDRNLNVHMVVTGVCCT